MSDRELEPLPPTESAIEGPFYRPGSPPITNPGTLVRRPQERGAVLVFSGAVVTTAGEPLDGAVLDLWQASAEGLYSPGAEGRGDATGLFDVSQPPFNLRGRVTCGAGGGFEQQAGIDGGAVDAGGLEARAGAGPGLDKGGGGHGRDLVLSP